MRKEIDEWKEIAFKLARHIRNTDKLPVITWGVRGGELLTELQAMDPELYDRIVKAQVVVRESEK